MPMKTLLILLFFYLIPVSLFAQTPFLIESQPVDGLKKEITIWISPSENSFNVIEGRFILSPFSEITNITTNDSIIRFWTDQPRVENNEIIFSGVIPGGFTHVLYGEHGGSGKLFSFEVDINSSVSLVHGALYLNDGNGTRVELRDTEFLNSEEKDFEVRAKDHTPPEWIQAFRSSHVPYGVKEDIIIFEAFDKESGVNYVEVKELGGTFKRSTTPYIISNTSLFNRIEMRAYDYAGNFSTLFIPSPIEKIIVPAIPFVLMGILCLLAFAYLLNRFVFPKIKSRSRKR